MSLLDEDIVDKLTEQTAQYLTIGSPYDDGFILESDKYGHPVWIAKFLSNEELGTLQPQRQRLTNSTNAYPAFRRARREGWDLPTLEQMKTWFGKTIDEVQHSWRAAKLKDSVSIRFGLDEFWCKTTHYDPNTGVKYGIAFSFKANMYWSYFGPGERPKFDPSISYRFKSNAFSHVLLVKKIK